MKLKPNAMVADDVSMQRCATAHCACKMAAMLTRETLELTGCLDLWLPPTIVSPLVYKLCSFCSFFINYAVFSHINYVTYTVQHNTTISEF